MFPLCDNRVKQFSAVKLRGYVRANGEYKNPFDGKSFEQAAIDYRIRSKERKARQAERKKRREENVLAKLRRQKEKEMKKTEKRKKEAVRKRRQRKKTKEILKQKNTNPILRRKAGQSVKRKRPQKENQSMNLKSCEQEDEVDRNQNAIAKDGKKMSRVQIEGNPNLVRKKRRNYAKENFEDRRVVAESFYD